MTESVATESEGQFIPPLPRPTERRETLSLLVSREVFLQAVEEVTPLLCDPCTGTPWTYDGYRQNTLYLRFTHHPLGIDFVTQFDLAFHQDRVQLSVASANEAEHLLYQRLTRALAIHLSEVVR